VTPPQYSLGVRLFRLTGPPLFRIIFRILARVSIVGLENVPSQGPYLIVFNHLAISDPPLVLAFWPARPDAVGASNMMDTFLVGHLMRWYGTVRVHRGYYDRRLLTAALACLKAGRPVLIAPEGGRSHTPGMRPARPGAAYLAIKAGVPLVPVGVTGTESLFSHWRPGRRTLLTMRIGKCFKLPFTSLNGAERHHILDAATGTIMSQIASLLPPEYRGTYG